MQKLKSNLTDVVLFAGVSLVVYGIALFSRPVAFIVAGGVLACGALFRSAYERQRS
jgi:hypothetical protein